MFFCQTASAYPYRIYTAPEGAIVKNILTNEVIGKTPVEVDVSNTEAGSTFGISMYRHENVAIKIFTVMPNAENNFTVSGPDVATMSLPGKAPLNVTNDSNAAAVHIDLRPFLSEPAHHPVQ
ncbi:TPA: hypothetical protein ACG646_005116 [Escherichia coli]|nr:hypothetical protein [Salmonella enterica]MJB17879.1 hypothetical protein [Salmonella enterica subsp. enterica serovar Schwarzengrund]